MVKTCANVGCGKRHGRNGVRVYSTGTHIGVCNKCTIKELIEAPPPTALPDVPITPAAPVTPELVTPAPPVTPVSVTRSTLTIPLPQFYHPPTSLETRRPFALTLSQVIKELKQHHPDNDNISLLRFSRSYVDDDEFAGNFLWRKSHYVSFCQGVDESDFLSSSDGRNKIDLPSYLATDLAKSLDWIRSKFYSKQCPGRSSSKVYLKN